MGVFGRKDKRPPAEQLFSALTVKKQLKAVKRVFAAHTGSLDVNQQLGDGRTFLLLAFETNKARIVDFLLANGADPSGPIRNEADQNAWILPIHAAAQRGLTEICESLVRAGADVDAQSSSGDTALHFAAAERRFWTCCSLLRREADTTLLNDRGARAIDMTRNGAVFQLLNARSRPPIMPPTATVSDVLVELATRDSLLPPDENAWQNAPQNALPDDAVIQFDERLIADACAMGFAEDHVNLALVQLYENGQATNDMTLLIETVTALQAVLGQSDDAPPSTSMASWVDHEANDSSVHEQDLVRRRGAPAADAAGPSGSSNAGTEDVLIEL